MLISGTWLYTDILIPQFGAGLDKPCMSCMHFITIQYS